jgi:hypothetical protein
MRHLLTAALAGLLPMVLCASASAEHLSATTQEVRIVLYYHLPPEKLAKFLPPGFTPADFTTGPATGANLTVNLSDQLSNLDAGSTAGSNARGQGVTISARVKEPKSGQNVSMVLFGFTNGDDSPGPYGTHRKATISMSRAIQTRADGQAVVTEHWSAKSPQGDALTVDVSFVRGSLTASHTDQQTWSSVHPDFYRIYKTDQQSDVVRSKSGGIDRASACNVTDTGEVAKYLDRSETPIAVVSVPVLHREIWLPN